MDHVAIVTGANHGIGAAVAERLAEAGAGVLVASWRVRVEEATATPEPQAPTTSTSPIRTTWPRS